MLTSLTHFQWPKAYENVLNVWRNTDSNPRHRVPLHDAINTPPPSWQTKCHCGLRDRVFYDLERQCKFKTNTANLYGIRLAGLLTLLIRSLLTLSTAEPVYIRSQFKVLIKINASPGGVFLL